MHQLSEHPEFIKTIQEIRDAEEEYDRLINSAKEKADKIMREAKEQISNQRMTNEQSITTYKNERLQDGSSEIETKVEEILSKAKDDGSKITKKKVEFVVVSKFVKEFLANL
ncbi:MAG: hypothetical protein ABID61_00090 [Candidatus Micrarchaeota archaeon]